MAEPPVTWPAPAVIPAAEALRDPERTVRAAERGGLGLTIAEPLDLGAEHIADGALRLLGEATSRFVDLRWELRGEPPWPLRTLVHLCPPAHAADAAGRRFAQRWREEHRFGQCTYRRGPGFVAVRDVRPDGTRQRALLDDPWVDTFDALVSDATQPVDPAGVQLLGELVDAGLAVRLGVGKHAVLPYRMRRHPIPYDAI